MHLTVDLTPTLLRSAGIKNHLFYWTRALQAAKRGHSIAYFPFTSPLDALHHDRGLEAGIPNWRLFFVAAFNAPTHPIARRLVPRAQLFHGSSQVRRRPRTALLTSHIHDLTCWIMPEMHTRANVHAAHQLASNIWSTADGLIAVSASARDDAVRLLGLSPDKIRVIHHGVPDEYFSVAPAEIVRVRTALRLKKPYALAVGTIEPRKNLDRLLDAWLALPPDAREAFDLVIAGPAGWKAAGLLSRLSASASGARYLGYVAEQDLAALTAGATLAAYPSLYEGFGFPLAQAMACGVPLLTSNVSSMPEVAAGGAILVDPHSTMEMRDALLRLLTTPDLRGQLGNRGRRHAEMHYRWHIAARESWEFFERIAG